MAQNEARRQKQLAKKKAKRDQKRRQLTSNDQAARLASASSWPIVDALVPEDLWDKGIGQLVIARRLPDGRLACGVYLVDTYCLGVKNAFWKIMSTSEFRDLQRRCGQVGRLRQVAPEYLAKLVHGAVEYAQSLGFAPHPDYRQARLLLSGIDPSLCSETFEFGKDGKPFYVRGPNESLEKAQAITQRIQNAGGECIIPLHESEFRRDALEELEEQSITASGR